MAEYPEPILPHTTPKDPKDELPPWFGNPYEQDPYYPNPYL